MSVPRVTRLAGSTKNEDLSDISNVKPFFKREGSAICI